MRRRCAQRCRNHRHTRSGRASFTCQSANQYRVNYAAVYSRQYAVIVFMHFTQRYILIACTNIISCDDHYDAILPRWGGAWGWGCALPRNFFLNFLNENGVHSGALFFKLKCLQKMSQVIFFAFTGTTCYNLTTIVLWSAVGTIPLLRTHLCVSNICLPL